MSSYQAFLWKGKRDTRVLGGISNNPLVASFSLPKEGRVLMISLSSFLHFCKIENPREKWDEEVLL